MSTAVKEAKEVVVTLTMSETEAKHLKKILNHSGEIDESNYEGSGFTFSEVESTSFDIYHSLSDILED